MKIYAYRVTQGGPRSVGELAAAIVARPLTERAFGDAGGGLRLEDYAQANGLELLNFARPRGGHGPGKMATATPLVDIPLEAGATFGEDVALAYDPVSEFAAVQVNHFGPRIRAIENYLWGADVAFGLGPPIEGVADEDRAGFTFSTCFRPEAFARLNGFQTVREIDFTVNVPGLNRAQFDAGQSLFRALRAPIPGGTQTVTVKLKAGRSRAASLAMDAVAAVFADLQHMEGDLIDGVVKGRADPDAPTTKVDLVDERLSAEVEIHPGHGHRFGRPERWMALRDTLRGWIENGQLP